MKIGVCGLGYMGSALAQRLMDVGHELAVWNRTGSKADALVSNSATWAETPKELISGSQCRGQGHMGCGSCRWS